MDLSQSSLVKEGFAGSSRIAFELAVTSEQAVPLHNAATHCPFVYFSAVDSVA